MTGSDTVAEQARLLLNHFCYRPADDAFDFIDSLPILTETFKGAVRWHVNLGSSNFEGPVFSSDSGARDAEGKPIFNCLVRRPGSCVMVFHCRQHFRNSASMMTFLASMYQVSCTLRSRLVMIGMLSPVSYTHLTLPTILLV